MLGKRLVLRVRNLSVMSYHLCRLALLDLKVDSYHLRLVAA